MREKQPFAVVGSNIVIVDNNRRKVRGRKYVWGTVDVENEVTNMYCS
jgi:septin family protein